jgi:hypothetical protein
VSVSRIKQLGEEVLRSPGDATKLKALREALRDFANRPEFTAELNTTNPTVPLAKTLEMALGAWSRHNRTLSPASLSVLESSLMALEALWQKELADSSSTSKDSHGLLEEIIPVLLEASVSSAGYDIATHRETLIPREDVLTVTATRGMKLFGEFLVEKKYISADSLLRALLFQMNELPSVCEIVSERRLLVTEDLLKVITYQTHHRCEFKKACVELGLWTEGIDEEVSRVLETVRIPIGQILVKQKAIELEKISTALDEYLATVKDGTPQTAFATIEPDVIQTYSELLSDTRIALIKETLKNVKMPNQSQSAEEELEEVFSLLCNGVHELKGVARFIRASLTEEMMAQLEDLVLSAKERCSRLSPKEIKELSQLCSDVMDTTSEIKKFLLKNGSEKGYWEKSSGSYIKLKGKLISLREKIEAKDLKKAS